MLGQRMERAHIIPNYLGGTSDHSNIVLIPIELHAFQHYLIADASRDQETKRINIWAVNKIEERMTREEKREADRLISLHNQDVRRRGGI